MLIGFQVNILPSFIFTCHLAFPAKLKLQLLHGKQRGGSFLCALLILSLNSFAGSESTEVFYILIFFFHPGLIISFTFIRLSSPLIPARPFLKVFWNNYVRLGRLLLLAISFVCNQSSFPKEIWFHHYKSQNLKECTNLHMINHRREAIPTHSCGHCSEHLLQGWICAWLRQVQKCWSCHHGALLTIHSTKRVSTQHLTALSPALLPLSPPARQWFGVGVCVCWSFCGVLGVA